MVAFGASLAVGLEERPLLAQPALAICRIVLHDLRSKRQCKLIVFTAWRKHLAKKTSRSGSEMVVDDALVLNNFGVCKQRRLRRTRGRGFVDGIEDRILYLLARRSCRGLRRLDWLAVGRDGWRHGQRVVSRLTFAIGSRTNSGRAILMNLAKAVENWLRR